MKGKDKSIERCCFEHECYQEVSSYALKINSGSALLAELEQYKKALDIAGDICNELKCSICKHEDCDNCEDIIYEREYFLSQARERVANNEQS